jgi:monoamine oxidase
VLLLFNIGEPAKYFSGKSDDYVCNSAMEVIRTWYPEAPDFINFKRSNWCSDPYAQGAWSFIKAGSTPGDCQTYQESESTGNKVFFCRGGYQC